MTAPGTSVHSSSRPLTRTLCGLQALPCVVFLHGNSGCRVDAFDAVRVLLPLNFTVFTLDFAGSGLSEGRVHALGTRR